MADFEAWLVFLILVVNVVGELQRKRTLAASRGFLAAARLSWFLIRFALRRCILCCLLLSTVYVLWFVLFTAQHVSGLTCPLIFSSNK